MNTGPVNVFTEIADNFFQRVNNSFEEYKVEHSKLPGTLGKDETFQATFGSNSKSTSSNMLSGEPIIIQLSIDGPTSKEGGETK